MMKYGLPAYICSDNGPEFIAQKVQCWLKKNTILIFPYSLSAPLVKPWVKKRWVMKKKITVGTRAIMAAAEI